MRHDQSMYAIDKATEPSRVRFVVGSLLSIISLCRDGSGVLFRQGRIQHNLIEPHAMRTLHAPSEANHT